MGEEFRPFAQILSERQDPCAEPAPIVLLEPNRQLATRIDARESGFALNVAYDEIALARLASFEAYERWTVRLLETLAHTVLARELQLAPVDVTKLSHELLTRFAAEEPVELRVAPSDAARVSCGIPTVADATLAAGDAVLVVRDGEVDARFVVRLSAAIGEADG